MSNRIVDNNESGKSTTPECIDSLWQELLSINDIQERRSRVYNDIDAGENRYKVLAENDSFRLFELLGGNKSNAIQTNWAPEYTYEDYIADYGEDHVEEDALQWDVKSQSIQRAQDLGFWYVTGTCRLNCSEGQELIFEIGFSEGYFDNILKTPYGPSTFNTEKWFEFH